MVTNLYGMKMLAFKNLFKPKRVVERGRYGVELAPTGLTVVHLDYSNLEKPVFDWCEIRDDSQQNWCASLSDIGKSHPYAKEPCSITLHPSFYQFMLIDAPDVADEEVPEAVKWKVSDLVDKPIEDLVVEVLVLPGDAYRGRLKMVYVAIVEKTLIQEISEMMDGLGLLLDKISVSELSLVEYMNWIEGYEDLDVALIQIGKDAAQICLMEHRQVYMARGIEISDEEHSEYGESEKDTEDDNAKYENVILDVQRSLDYYESQLGKPAIEMAFVFAAREERLGMLDQMSEQLNIPLTEFPFEDIVEINDFTTDNDSWRGREVLALGAALGGCHDRYHSEN